MMDDGPAADAAVFDIFRIASAGIDERGDWLAAVGAVDRLFVEFVDRLPSLMWPAGRTLSGLAVGVYHQYLPQFSGLAQ